MRKLHLMLLGLLSAICAPTYAQVVNGLPQVFGAPSAVPSCTGIVYDASGTPSCAATTQVQAALGTTTLSTLATIIANYGDSLTQGTQAGLNQAYPYYLQGLTGLTTENYGISGGTSTQIAVQEGGTVTTATVTGSSIPASGAVVVTFPSGYTPVTAYVPTTVAGTLCGVSGAVSDSSGTIYFTRTASGSAVACSGSQTFTVATPYNANVQVIWAGRNNYNSPTQLATDLASIFATGNALNRFFVSILPSEISTEHSGTSNYTQITADNTAIATAYPNSYINALSALMAAYNSSNLLDVYDVSVGIQPSSLRVSYPATLTTAISSTTTCTFSLSSPNSAAQSGDVLQIGSEYIYITTTDGANVTACTRGYASSTASTYVSGQAFGLIDLLHLNGAGYKVVAQTVAAYLKSKIANLITGSQDFGTQHSAAIAASLFVPQTTIYTVGSGVYVTPAGTLYQDVEMIGGGTAGTGSGGGSSQGGGAGGNTTFGSFTAGGGPANNCCGGTAGGSGGTATGGTDNFTGGRGISGSYNTAFNGGDGCTSQYGANGQGGQAGSANAGSAAVANSGAGGGGGATGSTGPTGPGGGCGGFLRVRIYSPAATYSYAVGAGGAGGAAGTGTSTAAGGAGGSGRIKVTAYFQ